nr:hypothetical protein [Tanacetum cinerariifolium]
MRKTIGQITSHGTENDSLDRSSAIRIDNPSAESEHYGDNHPLPLQFETDKWYLFTSRYKKHANDSIINLEATCHEKVIDDNSGFKVASKRVMSSPNHPTSDIKDAFSSNSPTYTPASPDFSPASPGNTPSESLNNSYGLVPIASPTLSLFHDDPYMKVMHAYDAIIPPQVPIPPPIIVPLSPMLSPIFNSQELFALEELFPPKKQTRLPSLSSTDLSNPSRKQAL